MVMVSNPGYLLKSFLLYISIEFVVLAYNLCRCLMSYDCFEFIKIFLACFLGVFNSCLGVFTFGFTPKKVEKLWSFKVLVWLKNWEFFEPQVSWYSRGLGLKNFNTTLQVKFIIYSEISQNFVAFPECVNFTKTF